MNRIVIPAFAPPTYKCKECEKVWCDIRNFRRHEKIHKKNPDKKIHKFKRDGEWRCDMKTCKTKYETDRELRVHLWMWHRFDTEIELE